jgi:hypothetical protein
MLRNNADVHYLFIDFQEAYDSVWIKGILSEIHEVSFQKKKKIVKLCRILNDETYAKVNIYPLNLKLTKVSDKEIQLALCCLI